MSGGGVLRRAWIALLDLAIPRIALGLDNEVEAEEETRGPRGLVPISLISDVCFVYRILGFS